MAKGSGTTRASSSSAPKGLSQNDNGGGYQRMDRYSFMLKQQAELDDLDKRTSFSGDLSKNVREADREYFRAEEAYKNSLYGAPPSARESAKKALDEADEKRRKANAEYDKAMLRIRELRYSIDSTR